MPSNAYDFKEHLPVMHERGESQKTPHDEVGYVSQSKDADRCVACKHYIRAVPLRCETVKSPIAVNGWCERFERKN